MSSLTFSKAVGGTSRGYLREIVVKDGTQVICELEQAVGHCCGATMLSQLTYHGFWNDKQKVQMFIDDLKSKWKQADTFRDPTTTGALSCFTIAGFFVFLSVETAGHDKALREHPDLKKITSFRNKSNGPGIHGNTISLYQMEF